MKILKISTFPHGGATIAARRQKDALRRAGHDCTLVCIRENGGSTAISTLVDDDEIILDVPASAWSYSGRITMAYCSGNRSDISNTWFSFWPCETFLDDELLKICLDFDVIHLHWIAHMVSSRLLSKLRLHSRRIVITGHDMNHFTGGCHYSAGCLNFQDVCRQCPQLVVDPLDMVESSFTNKLTAFSELPATWIFPSIWLADMFRKSRLSDHRNPKSCKVVYNCIDTDKFVYLHDADRQAQRNIFGFFANEMVLVAGAADNSELRKGFDYIESGVKQLAESLICSQVSEKHCVIVTFGRGKPYLSLNTPFIRHLHLGEVNEREVIKLLQAADLLLFPSIEENFSNLILESLMCGCPVLAFRVGGVPDIVNHENNGWIVDVVSHQNYGNALASVAQPDCLRKMRKLTEIWRDQSAGRYSYHQISSQLMEIYRNTSEVTRRQSCLSNTTSFSRQHYDVLFRRVVANDTSSHSMLAANIRKHVGLAINRKIDIQRHPNYSIPAIYAGFTDMVHYEPLGRVSWLLKKGAVIFKPTNSSKPALLLGVPNHDWVPALVDSALSKLAAKVNDIAADVMCFKPINVGGSFYIWIIPRTDSLKLGGYNTLNLDFSEASVPEANDPRGMSILCASVTLFDLSLLSLGSETVLELNYAITSAMALFAQQHHYLWEDWGKEINSTALLRNDMETWLDLLGAEGLAVGQKS